MHLPALQMPGGAVCLLELDHPLLLAEQLHLGLGESASQGELNVPTVTSELMQFLSPDISGAVLSAECSYYALEQKAQHTGVVFSLEKQLEPSEPLSVPALQPGWGVEQCRHNYALVKLSLSYHPEEKVALQKRQLVAELSDFCHHEGIDFVLELNPVHDGDLEQVLLQSVNELRSLADLLVLPPSSALTTVTITAQLDIPWIMTVREGSYETFKEQLRVSLEGGAVGFLAGAAVWGDVWARGDAQESAQRQKLIQTVVRDRFVELKRITQEATGIATH